MFAKVYLSAVNYYEEMHKSMIKNIPLSSTFPYIYYYTTEFPISAVKEFTLVQKLQVHVLVCLFLLQNGFKTALHFEQ